MKDPIVIILEQAGEASSSKPDLPGWYYEDEAEVDAICAVEPEDRIAAVIARVRARREGGLVEGVRAELAGQSRKGPPLPYVHEPAWYGPLTVLQATPEQLAAARDRDAADELELRALHDPERCPYADPMLGRCKLRSGHDDKHE